MTHLPPDILLLVVEEVHLLYVDPSRIGQIGYVSDYYGYAQQLCRLRLVNRTFARSSIIKERLFKTVSFKFSQEHSDRLKVTYKSISPYVRTLSIAASLYDSKLSRDVCFKDFYTDACAVASDKPEIKLLLAWEEYHARALKDEAAEDEIAQVSLECFRSFRGLEYLSLNIQWGRNSPESGEQHNLSIIEFCFQRQHFPYPILTMIYHHTGNRLLRQFVPLLYLSEFQLKNLYTGGPITDLSLAEKAMSALSALKEMDLPLIVPSKEPTPDALLTAVQTQQASLAAASSTKLFHKCLEASQICLEELSLHTTFPPFRGRDGLFPSNIRCDRLRTLRLSGKGIQLGSVRLISSLEVNFPNLECITFGETWRDKDEEVQQFWPEFLGKLPEIVQGKKFKIEGEFEVSSFTLYFSTTLNVPYPRAWAAFQEKTCNYRTALSTAIRRYMDGLASWDLVTDTIDELDGNGWDGEYDGNTDYDDEEEED